MTKPGGSNSGSNSRSKPILSRGSHLRLRRRRWVYRRSIPPELQGRLGRVEITKTLETSDLIEAERLAAALDREVDTLFSIAARDEALDAEALIERICGQFFRQLLAEDRASRRSEQGDVDLVLSEIARDLAGDLQARRYGAIEGEARALLQAEGVEREGERLEALLHELLRTRIVALKKVLSEREGDEDFEPRSGLSVGGVLGVAQAELKESDKHSVSELAKLYIRDRTETKAWKPGRGAHDRTQQVHIFVEFLGAETRLSEVTPERCMELRTHLSEGRAPGTVDKYMRALIALFNFAWKRQRWIPFNPADGLRLPQRNVQEDRHPYSNEDLATLFGKERSGDGAELPRTLQNYLQASPLQHPRSARFLSAAGRPGVTSSNSPVHAQSSGNFNVDARGRD